MFGEAEQQTLDDYDLTDVQASGELIAVTLSGPDTYYEYRGQGFGLQYAMSDAFARSIGARLRMEMASDTAELFHYLLTGEADLIALELDTAIAHHYGGEEIIISESHWILRRSSPELAEALDMWWRPNSRSLYLAAETSRKAPSNRVRRHVRPPMLSHASGTISSYDALFIRHAQRIGWDWRLLAAQCYQESGFDPKALSWAGACGLMQLMPSTAELMGITQSDIYDPEKNISAAVRYLSKLNSKFSDIHNSHERMKFVLAAYNGGAGHVRDAMTLATEDGHSTQRWDDVRPYIMALEDSRYYRRPSVQYGYLRGNETVEYVQQILQRWATYRGAARPHATGHQSSPSDSRPSRVRPRSSFDIDSIHHHP